MAADTNFIVICINCTQAGKTGKVTYNIVPQKDGILIQYHCFNCGISIDNKLISGIDTPAKNEKEFLKRIKNRKVTLGKVN